ncbi:hypothetical protein TDB9533_03598 [Thalassocella blandensis]|nr:hypothetical protein TDB9533_03598 [Thalassocella blandensis]
MNRYPLWKYALIVITVIFGALYALPNIYAPDPAIQISGSSASTEIDAGTMQRVESALKAKSIEFFGVEFTEANGLVRLYKQEDQLRAQRAVQQELGEREYVVAVSLAPTTPEWLTNLGAEPMKLGLDLAGGVHFLLEVDTKKVITEDFESIETQIKRFLREERLRGVKIRLDDETLVIASEDEDARNKITAFLRTDVPALQYDRLESNGEYLVHARMSDAYIREKETLAVQQNLTALRKRVNELGVSEPLVQRQGRNRIVVQLPGIQDTARAKAIIGKTANLEFRLESRPSTLASQKEEFDWREAGKQQIYGPASLEKRAFVKGEHVTNASASIDPETNLPQINISLNSDGGSLIFQNTKNNVGRRMGVLFIEYHTRTNIEHDEDGKEIKTFTQIPEKKIISLATIQSPLNMNFRITGIDSMKEASEVSLLLRAGALAAPMGFVEERTIGPSLGKQNVDSGIKSVQFGLAMVLIFMLVYYRVFGLAANIALAVNLTLLVAIMSIFGATLTLPGIAGIVLTVGMAVDANVLIFSRIREELAAGLSPQSAISTGFDRAFVTILDANITTFIVAIILYAIGSGPIKGFAVTLAIGIITSMFTAIMCSRAIVNIIYGNRTVKKLWI